jgi:cytidine deaminase
VSLNPFRADPDIASRFDRQSAEIGDRLSAEITKLAAAKARRPEDNLGSMLLAEEVAILRQSFGLGSVEELMLLALAPARGIARPPISNFFVGAVGLERETGNLILGGNMEFPGTHLGLTIHGEGFVFTRAASRGTTVETIAIGEAHPCAHCRQYISEFATNRELTLIDPLGHRLTMAQLYPWPFDPDYLGEVGAVAGAYDATLDLAANDWPTTIADRLLDTGRRAHAPYSKCPGAVVLALRDGRMVSGFSIESVAFNPTMGPLQAAMINLIAHGYEAADIAEAALGTRLGGNVDYSLGVIDLLGKLAPAAPLSIVGWA